MSLLKRLYYVLKAQKPIWKYVVNARAHSLYRASRPALTQLEKRIVADLERDGIARTSLSDFFANETNLDSLLHYAESKEQGAQSQHRKGYLLSYWSNRVPLDADNPFLMLSLNASVLRVASAYLGMWTRLKHYTLNLTQVVPAGAAPEFSQRWHRDPQEKRMLKMFIYLSDVDEGAGPFTYVRGSTSGNRYGSVFPQRFPEGSYPPPSAVEEVVTASDIQNMTGPAGTLIFCDTTGLHRGGYATERERLMFTSFYCAPSYKDEIWYTDDGSFDASELPRVAQFALHKY